MIVSGERRYHSGTKAGLTELPCIIKEMTDEEAYICQLIENLQREDLGPVEEAVALQKLVKSGLTQNEIAAKIGKSQPYVNKMLQIANIPEDILKKAAGNTNITKQHLFQIAKSDNVTEAFQRAFQGVQAKDLRQGRQRKNPEDKPSKTAWKWKPKDKSFTIQIKFRNKEPDKDDIVRALEAALAELRGKGVGS